ncbi:Polysaccharide biosynthesis/export protein [Botrimarina colliarenosi]|uniref:Polysaccharide biosynthesis/export protein n=1 Tax=Botrimarina colliarenosi TaxID=2528001 RepID=A0A5C6A881_9BACT|nr:polysaccharide biosynthesis/export family protein [Botrimarina colliarenosi]TWT96164.1 Polysaccharide biosynthesis/export protein [Botrimarina colliarenosi]
MNLCTSPPHHSARSARHSVDACRLAMVALAVASLAGCAAFTNPVANGIPVRMVPDDLLAESREGYEPINLAMLRTEPPKKFLLDAGDTLGIYIEGIIGDASTPPPVNLPSSSDLPPAIGYPFPIRDDGAISLPLAGSVHVAGMTIEEAEDAVIRAYLDKEIIREEDFRIIVTLLRARTVRVLVVREDGRNPSLTIRNPGLRGIGSASTTVGGETSPTGDTLELPIYENDLLNALTQTGGVPNSGITPEAVIYRGYAPGEDLPNTVAVGGATCPCDDLQSGKEVIRVPLRKRCDERVSIPRENIVLQDGDIVTLRALEPERFYTGGLLPAGEQVLPYDYDLTVIEAVLRTNGPLVNGGVNSSNLNGNIVGGGLGNPSPSQLTVLRSLPNGQRVNITVNLNEALRDSRMNILVQTDDILLLQENRDEALSRYFFNSVFRMDFFFRVLNRNDGQGSASLVLP